MSWPLALSQYRRSILKTDTPLIVLALCEKHGLSTEEELAKDSDVSLPALKRVLFDLRMNQLIEYGSHYLRLTIEGSHLLARMRLEEPIIDCVLDELNIGQGEQERYRQSLKAYRSTAFDYYLNSLSAMRVWRQIVSSAAPDASEEQKSVHTKAGMHAILMRDLKSWVNANEFTCRNVASNDSETHLRGILLTASLLHDVGCYHLADEKENFSTNFVRSYDRLVDVELRRTVQANAEEQTSRMLPLLLAFSSFQQSKEPDYWFDDWHEMRQKWPVFIPGRSIKNYIRRIIVLLREKDEDAPEKRSIAAPLLQSNCWRPQITAAVNTYNFVEKLLSSSSIAKLAQMTSTDVEPLSSLLKEVRDKCNELLEKAQTQDAGH